MSIPYWELDDIDCTSWELAMKTAFKRHAFSGEKQYVWAYKSGRDGRVSWSVSAYAPTESWEEAFG